MKLIKYPPKASWARLCQRPSLAQEELGDKVKKIIDNVQQQGDKALLDYTAMFDGVELESLLLPTEKYIAADKKIPTALKKAIELASNNIRQFHAAQADQTLVVEATKGVRCWRRSLPIDTVGLYIPGGTAPLFSTVLMLGIPAQIAGCREVIICTPPNKDGEVDPAILYAARVVGVEKVYLVGGAQAIAAMALGTASIPKVDKIFGPGNQYVTKAKELVQQQGVAIDMPAGPSELLVIADTTANPVFVAADLLSQAEHGVDSQVVLLSDNEEIATKCLAALKKQLAQLPRQSIAAVALENSCCIVLENIEECIAWSNEYAPEHLILAVDDVEAQAMKINNAGSVFLGNYSCESAGDYASGTNHTLPTNGYAKSYSGVSLDSFVKKITFQSITPSGLERIGPAIEVMASAEDLFAHKNAVTVRLEEIKQKSSNGKA